VLRQRRSRGPRVWKLHKPHWIDPYPQIPGTEPEKRLFEVLVRHRLYFIFQGQIHELEKGLYVTLSIPGYKPDFVLPEYKVILDPFSPFHHSLPEAMARDAKKYGLYTALGYSYYFPWAVAPGVFVLDQKGVPKVRGGAEDIIAAIPEFQHAPKYKLKLKKDIHAKAARGYRLGENLGVGSTSVAAANRARTRPADLTLVYGTRKRKRRGRALGT
jgi:hypothetical protein